MTDAAKWSAFDAGANGVGTDPDGYVGAVFDGRYLYCVPQHNGAARHGEVLRYDTQASFGSAGSWQAFDPGANGVGTDPDGFRGGVFDGRYVYFVPQHNGTDFHGEVLRYDTQAAFTAAASWLAFDPGANGVGADADGYQGAAYDGRYIYFAPWDNGAGFHGEVLRYDTQGAFAAAGSWAAFDPGANGVGTDPDGFAGAVFDGRHVYFLPYHNGTANHGEVLRYDTQGTFAAAGSWAAFDAGANGVGGDPDGFAGGVFDGRYLYLVPQHNGSNEHGEVLRYDTQASFTAAGSWAAFDPGANGLGVDADGYQGGVFDGRYVYLVPQYNGTALHGEVLRYDTQATFGAVGSWSVFNPATNGIGTNPGGYGSGAFDGRYVYFIPFEASVGVSHGEMLRFDAKTPSLVPSTVYGGSFY